MHVRTTNRLAPDRHHSRPQRTRRCKTEGDHPLPTPLPPPATRQTSGIWAGLSRTTVAGKTSHTESGWSGWGEGGAVSITCEHSLDFTAKGINIET